MVIGDTRQLKLHNVGTKSGACPVTSCLVTPPGRKKRKKEKAQLIRVRTSFLSRNSSKSADCKHNNRLSKDREPIRDRQGKFVGKVLRPNVPEVIRGD